MLSILSFWFIIQLFALAVLPLAWRLFEPLPGRGYGLVKPLGLLLGTYVLWLGGSLGFLRNSTGGALFGLMVVGMVAWWLGRRGWQRDAAGQRPLLAWLAAHKTLVVVTEVLFLVALAGWAVVRSYSPEITTAGGEKFMELTFLNGILRSPYFPPLDPWLSGFAISYYYFGYVMLALLTRLSGLAPGVAFNVGLATWFALTVTAAFSVAFDMAAALLARASVLPTSQSANLPTSQSTNFPISQSPNPPTSSSAYVAGFLGALFVGVLSNLEGFLESLHSLGVGPTAFWRWLDIKDLNCLAAPSFTEPVANCPTAGGLLPERFFWWWRASRVINDRDLLGNVVEVIDEFPFFSFLLGDMHPHVLALPFVLLAVGLALAIVLRGGGRDGVKEGEEGEEGEEGKKGKEGKGGKEGKAVIRREQGDPDPLPVTGHGSPVTDHRSRFTGHRSPVTVHRSPLTDLLAVFPMGAAGFALYALGLGALAFLNTWDFPIYLFLVMLSLGAALSRRRGGLSWRVAGQSLLVAGALGVAGVLLYLPFYFGFQSQAGGILPNFVFPTRLSQLFVMFGPLLTAAIFLLIALSDDRRQTLRRSLHFLPLTLLAPLIFLLAALVVGVTTPGGQEFVARLRDLPAVREQVGDASLAQIAGQVAALRLGSPWAYLFLGGLLAWVLALLAAVMSPATPPAGSFAGVERGAAISPAPARSPATTFALLALLTALLLVFSVEFVYLRDTFGVRMNTVFKFYYQAWVLLALVGAFAVVYLACCAGRGLRVVGLATVTLLVVAGLFYPVLGAYTRAERFQRQPTLDGTAYLRRDQPADAAAVDWLRANVPTAATVLEASGGSYSYAGRISAQTGLPTLLGWDGHELQWRGNTVEQDRRRPDIERIYRTAQSTELQQLLSQWQIDYVIVGDLERSTYGVSPQVEARLARVMDLVYDSQNVRIYRRRG